MHPRQNTGYANDHDRQLVDKRFSNNFVLGPTRLLCRIWSVLICVSPIIGILTTNKNDDDDVDAYR